MHIGDVATFTITPLDDKGNVAKFPDGTVPVWTFSDASAGTFLAAPDGMTATFTAATVGTDTFGASVTLKGVPIPQTISVPVVAGEASTYRIDMTVATP